ncbi:uncharacterized protein LOC135708531 [Ochlerotatus camptorhynchus]|uniref:uncharacterized protein LOC135708531 n=1 Tax=Ochlerotatus camptorhynchus TaxID=644619 RepID=UPI0031E004A1
MWKATGVIFGYIALLSVVIPFACCDLSHVPGDAAELDYSSMPKLHQYDDYGRCLKQGSTYCMVRSLVKPRFSSGLWQQIQNFSEDVRHYRHNLLDRGICIDECLRLIGGLSKSQRDELRVESFQVDFNYRFKRKYFPHRPEHERLYGDAITLCINQKLKSSYDLKAYSDIEYCQESGSGYGTLNIYDGLCIALICFVFGMAILSTFFDYYLRSQSDLPDHFGVLPQMMENRFATICSIPRNFKTLSCPPRSPLSQDFMFLEGLRFITMVTIVHLHTTVMLMNVPSEHPELFEETLHNPVMASLSLFTPNLVQSFFTIGGILLAVNLLDSMSKQSSFRWSLLWEKVTNRLKRILPLYLFIIMVTATIFRHLRIGPLYDRIIAVESKNCQENWWVNLLFLNNYLKSNETCVQPSWYLSADFQFYLIGMIALMTIQRYPRSAKYWIVSMVSLSLLGPGLAMWIEALPPLMATGTRPVLLLFTDDEWFARLYKPFHTSSAGYFYGVLAGMMYHRVKSAGDEFVNWKVFKAVKILSLMVVVICYAPAYLIYDTNWASYSWMPFYGSIAKNCWGFLCAVTFIELAFSKQNRLRSLLEHRSLLPLGKLTYSVYHSHYLILMAISSSIRAPLANDVFTPIVFTGLALILSYGFGLVVFLFVEQPAANLLTGKNDYIDFIGEQVMQGARRKMKKKMDSIMKKLADEKSARIELSNQLDRANETIMTLQASLATPRSGSVDSGEFSGNAGPSSTQHQVNETAVEMSRFMSSMNQMSITSINVPECKSVVAGEPVGRRDYESWIDLLTASLKLAGVEDERTRFIVFKVKAGPVLLEIFKNTKSTPEAPDEETCPLSNAMFRLKTYFGSASDIMLQRQFGMFRCVRLPFGLCNAPDIFQEVLQRKILVGCKGVKNYLDDILIFARTQEEHDENLDAVLTCLREHNVKINASKCTFKSQSVKFLGFRLTSDGWQIEEEKISAIRDFRRPDTIAEVKIFLGLVTFVDKFVPHRANKTEKLRALAQADTFYWSAEEEHEFRAFKDDALKMIKTLGYFNTSDRTELFVDASAIGLGAVLVQFNDHKIPRIIACASKALTAVEQRYPQTHREALAVVWGVERFAYYLSSRSFIIRTDAEANQFIFGGKHRIGKRAVSRAEAWALRLQPFDFTIERVPGEHNVADVLSRLIKMSQDAEPFEDSSEDHVLFTLDTGNMDISLGEIEVTAELDEELSHLRKALNLWTDSRSKELDRENVREVDAEAKLYSKHYADEVRGAKECNIKVGDIVLMSQQRKCKSDPMFSSERFTVVARTGAKVVIMSNNGVQYARNVQDVKLAPPAKEVNVKSNIIDQDDIHQHTDCSGMVTISEEDSANFQKRIIRLIISAFMDGKVVLLALVIVQCLPTTIRAFGIVDYNMTEYWQMPALFQYENFESCLRSKPDGVFCIVKSVVKSDDRSEIWRAVKKYSKYPYQYHHEVLTRGICLKQCEELVNEFGEQQRARLLQSKFSVDFRYIINDWLLPNISHYRQQYGSLVNICLNYRFQSTHNITVFSEIEHCITNATTDRPSDFWDILFYATIALLLTLVLGSSIYDYKLTKEDDQNCYRKPFRNKLSTLLTAFSLRRNINRLTIKLKTNQILQDLRFLDAIRVWIMTLITISHVVIGLAMTTTQSPEVMEKFLSVPGVQMFFAVVPFQVDFFFAISGLLLSLQFTKYTQTRRFSWKPFWMGLVNRYLRSLPVYAVLMLFTVSVYDRLPVSPSAYRILPTVRRICRDKWWTNFLFINNYYRPEEQCLIHTWYLAADFQLFVVGFALLMVLWKFQNIERPMALVLLAVGTVLPMLNIYYHSMDAMMLLTNKGNAFQLWYDKWFTQTYQATESHCISYFGGILVGIIYHKMQNDDLYLAKSKLYKTLQYTVFPLVVLFSVPAPLFHHYDFEKPSVWMAIYAGLHRLVVASFLNVGFLVLMFADRDSFFGRLKASKMLENAYYRVLGRLSFGFYLIHMNVLKTVYASYNEGLRGSLLVVINVFCSVTMLTYALATCAYLFVEKPCDIMFKQLLGGDQQARQETGATAAAPALENNPNEVMKGELKRRTSVASNV